MFYLEHISFSASKGLVLKDKMGQSLTLSSGIGKILNRVYNYILDLELLVLRIVSFFPSFLVRRFFFGLGGVGIGRRAFIHMGVDFFNPRGVRIGEGSIIGRNAFLDGRARLTIGKHVDIASDVMIYNSEHDINSADFVANVAEVEIGDFAFIGPRAIILPGVKVGKGAVVAAGAVVTHDVNDFQIVAGVPAKVIGERAKQDLHYKLGRARLFQ